MKKRAGKKLYVAERVCVDFFAGLGIPLECSPLDAARIINGRRERAALKSGSDEPVELALRMSSMLKSWMEYKQAYRFPEGLVQDLYASETAGCRIADLNIPFPCIYADLAGYGIGLDGPVTGMFIEVSKSQGIVKVLPVTGEGKSLAYGMCWAKAAPGASLKELLDGAPFHTRAQKQVFRLALNIITYLSMDEADVRPRVTGYAPQPGESAPRTGGTGKPSAPRETKMWDVGYRYVSVPPAKKGAADAGTVLAEAADAQADRLDPQADTGQAMPGKARTLRAHVRGGHWQAYWCGKGRTQRRVRWVAPYTAGSGEAVSVIRKLPETDNPGGITIKESNAERIREAIRKK